ncbi:MAG: acylphosphatase [Methanothrix sp.]|nr:acylphosphatase [Methanothrix sp.]
MKRLTAYVSGKVQRVGYRARVIQLANGLGLKDITMKKRRNYLREL